jgi:hypothetical protein
MLLAAVISLPGQAQEEISVYLIGDGDPGNLRNSIFIDLLGNGLTFTNLDNEEVTVPGLGYTVNFVDDDVETRPAAEETDILIVIESAGSTNIMQLADIPLPILAMEVFIFTGRADRPGSLFFAPENALNCCPTGDFEMEVITADHPITEIYEPGQLLQVTQNETDAQILGLNPEALGEAAVPLTMGGLNSTPDAPWASLAVMDAGASGLAGNEDAVVPEGAEPTPARRAYLGFQERVHIFRNEPIDNFDIAITEEGAYLFQRTVQWLLGVPVTAGGGTAVDHWITQ